jgi:hypothetical protein
MTSCMLTRRWPSLPAGAFLGPGRANGARGVPVSSAVLQCGCGRRRQSCAVTSLVEEQTSTGNGSGSLLRDCGWGVGGGAAPSRQGRWQGRRQGACGLAVPAERGCEEAGERAQEAGQEAAPRRGASPRRGCHVRLPARVVGAVGAAAVGGWKGCPRCSPLRGARRLSLSLRPRALCSPGAAGNAAALAPSRRAAPPAAEHVPRVLASRARKQKRGRAGRRWCLGTAASTPTCSARQPRRLHSPRSCERRPAIATRPSARAALAPHRGALCSRRSKSLRGRTGRHRARTRCIARPPPRRLRGHASGAEERRRGFCTVSAPPPRGRVCAAAAPANGALRVARGALRRGGAAAALSAAEHRRWGPPPPPPARPAPRVRHRPLAPSAQDIRRAAVCTAAAPAWWVDRVVAASRARRAWGRAQAQRSRHARRGLVLRVPAA